MNLQLLRGGDTVPDDRDLIMVRRFKACRKQEEAINLMWMDATGCSQLYKQLQDKYPKGVDYNWMIAYWMMEGFLGHIDCVEQAYHRGHNIFMELKYKHANNSSASDTSKTRFWNPGMLGLGDVLEEDDLAEFEPLVPHNGVLTTFKDHRHHHPLVRKSLLLDGNQLHRDVPSYLNPNLKHLVYFNPVPELIQPTLKLPGLNLTVLVLRGCAFLRKISKSVGDMSGLKVLEISGPSPIKKIPDIFSNLTDLRSLNLYGLDIVELPKSFRKLISLRMLSLRYCSRLDSLPSTDNMSKLEFIDLYGATSLTSLASTKLELLPIRNINLSHTRINRVPRLFRGASSSVTHLWLRNCSEIYVFDVLEKFHSLQVLDLSGAKQLKQIKTFKHYRSLAVLDLSRSGLSYLTRDGFESLIWLEDLNLSNTFISSLPPMSHLIRLRKLIVRGCESLETLEMKGLMALEVLDAGGCKMLQGLGDVSYLWRLLALDLAGCSLLTLDEITFHQFSYIRYLDLSGTNIDNFQLTPLQYLELEFLNLSHTPIQEPPTISNLKCLKQLLLAGCLKLSSIPDLKQLIKLEVLDLSRTSIAKESLHNAPTSLKKLLLKDCPGSLRPLSLESFTQLQELDLRGSSVEGFPYDLVGMTYLNCLGLPHKIRPTEVDWSRIRDKLPNEIIWDQPANIFESVYVKISNGVEQYLSAKPWSESHLFRLVDSQDSWEAYFNQFQFSADSSPEEEDKEGVISFGGVDLVFKGPHPLSGKEPFIKPNCPSVEIHGFPSLPEVTKGALKEAANVALGGLSFISSLTDDCFENMESMKVCWIKNCSNMKFVYGGKHHKTVAFRNLETLVLSNLTCLKAFSPYSNFFPLQSIASLKHMYIDCCPVLTHILSLTNLPENLETLHVKFCDKLIVFTGMLCFYFDCVLPKLHTLNLLSLPKLQQIGAELPSLETLVINQCPELVDLEHFLGRAPSCLTRMTLDCCPKLEYVFSSSMLPEIIQELEILSCDELTAVFDSPGPSSSSSNSLPSLCRLQLWNLPKLQSIGGDFPCLEACEIKYCSRLPRNLWPQVKTSVQEPR